MDLGQVRAKRSNAWNGSVKHRAEWFQVWLEPGSMQLKKWKEGVIATRAGRRIPCWVPETLLFASTPKHVLVSL